jgi:hypothetical protein
MNRSWLLSLLSVQSVAIAAMGNLAPEHYQALDQPSRFVPMTKLPASIVALCADSNGRLALPGEKWEPADVIYDASLPRKRLIWAALSDHYVVHYERGGHGHSFHILVAAMKNGEARAVWRAIGDRFENYSDFLDAVRTERLDDDGKYPY